MAEMSSNPRIQALQSEIAEHEGKLRQLWRDLEREKSKELG